MSRFAELCEGTPFDTMDMIVEVVFLAEIVMNFLIGRYTDNGKYLGHFRQIALDYAFGGFLNNLGFDAHSPPSPLPGLSSRNVGTVPRRKFWSSSKQRVKR